MHTGHVVVDGVKMAKSLGNGVSLSQALKDNEPDLLRVLCLLSHYQDR